MLVAAQFMVDFQGMHFNANKALYTHFQKHTSIFCKAMLITINFGGHVQFYVLMTNYYFPIEDRYSGLIFQHDLANILNLSQIFVKLLHQPTKPHGLVGQFPNRHKGNKEACGSIDSFFRQLKYYIG